MRANYHTHTWRCRHADGTEREYVENAIEAGLKVLGFSDHSPQVYPGGFVCPVKMLPTELEGYVDTVLDLKREYTDDIEILLGDSPFTGSPTGSIADLKKYCSQTLEAVKTGKFLYFAHPDVIWYTGPDEIYEEEMTRLCRYCAKVGIPMEINLLGVREDRNYPDERFWKIVEQEGNPVIYGSDAHHPDHVLSPEVVAKADRFLEKCGIPRDRLFDVIDRDAAGWLR